LSRSTRRPGAAPARLCEQVVASLDMFDDGRKKAEASAKDKKQGATSEKPEEALDGVPRKGRAKNNGRER
jgi:hypothetical protein